MIIALQGYKGSGKDYVGKLIAKRTNAKLLAFADPLKKLIMETFKLNSIEEYDAFKRSEFNGVLGRDIVRNIGMAIQYANTNYFVDKLDIEYIRYRGISVITDLRFNHELKYVRSYISSCICTVVGGDADGHISESLPHPVDNSLWTFDNRAKDDSIIEQVDAFVQYLKTRKDYGLYF
jgi:hypothetical protein